MNQKYTSLLTLLCFLVSLSNVNAQLDCNDPHNVLINCSAGLLPYEFCGTTVGAPSNESQYCDETYVYSGGEQVIILNLIDGAPFSDEVSINLTLTNTEFVDFDIYLFSSCDLSNCLASATSGSSETETLSYTGSSISDVEDAFIVIEGYNGFEADYNLTIDVQYVNSSANPVNSISTKIHQLANDPPLCSNDFPIDDSVWPLFGSTTDISMYSCGNEGIFTGFKGAENFYKIETSTVSDLAVNLSQTNGGVHAFVFRNNFYTANCSPNAVVDCFECLGYATESNPFTLQNAAVEEYVIVVDAPNSGAYTLDVDFDDTCNDPTPSCEVWDQIGNDIDGEATNDYSGLSVSLSADGMRVAIGAPLNDGNGENSGHVRIYEEDGGSWIPVGGDIDGEAAFNESGASVSLSENGTRVAIGAKWNSDNGDVAGQVRVYEENGGNWIQIGNDINGAPNNGAGIVSLSADGNTVAVGAPFSNNLTGLVRIYREKNGGVWEHIATMAGEATNNEFGNAVSLSPNGTRVAIGAFKNDGNGSNSGHVRVYEENGNNWVKIGDDIDGEASGDFSGYSVALSSDGFRVAVGATENDGNGENAGHVRIYEDIGGTWTKIGEDIDGEAAGDYAGFPVSLSADGKTVAISSVFNDGNGENAGHVRIFKETGGIWTQIACDINGEAANDLLGSAVSLSADGNRVAIGARANDGNGENAGHVRVYNSGLDIPTDEVIFKITENICSSQEDVVSVPVTVQHFDNIGGFQMSIHVADPNTATIVGASDFNLPNMNNNTFQVTNNGEAMLVTWFNAGSVTLADNVPIFSIGVSLVGSAGEASEIFIDGDPTPFVVFDNDVNPLPATSTSGSVCINATSEIFGKIRRENNDEISQATIKLTGGQTLDFETTTDGLYEFGGLSPSGNYTVTPSKDINPVNGVNVGDILKIQKFINQAGNFLATPYQRIAADVSNDGLILVNDILFIQKLINNNISTFPNGTPSWKFVSSDYAFVTNTPEGEDFAQSRVFDQLSSTLNNQDFIGVKMGDVDDSGNPQNISDNGNSSRTSEAAEVVELFMEAAEVSSGGLVTIPIKANYFSDMGGMQFSVKWDKSALSYIGLKNLNLKNLNQSSFSEKDVHNGSLTLTWFTNGCETLADSSVLFEIQFEAIGTKGYLSEISFSDNPTAISFFGCDTNPLQHKVTNGNVIIHTSTTKTNDLEQKMLPATYPNPVQNQLLNIDFTEFREIGECEIKLIDTQGRVLKSHQTTPSPTLIKLPVDVVPGIYFLEIFTRDFKFTERVFVR